jgi:hypothetical protein
LVRFFGFLIFLCFFYCSFSLNYVCLFDPRWWFDSHSFC